MHRYRSWARQHAADTSQDPNDTTILPPYDEKSPNTNESGGLNSKQNGRGSPSGSSAIKQQSSGAGSSKDATNGGDYFSSNAEKSATDKPKASAKKTKSAPAAPQDKSQNEGSGDTAIADGDGNAEKPPIPKRMLNGCGRFFVHMKDALFHSWLNILLVFVPIGIAVEAVGLSAGIIFGMNAVAIVPLAGLLAYATESVASRLGDTLGALLNVSFGNAVELIIFIIALVKNEISIVQASLLGSILANLLLILGMSFLFGGLRYREQVYNSTVTQMSACLLSLSVMSLLLPTAFYASFSRSSASLAQNQVLKVSRGTSVVLLLVYILYLLFQLKSHAYMYESTPQEVIDEESHPGVLADIMNSSSSSDDSSSSSTSDTDSSGSGSIATAGKKIKRVFKKRGHRKSSASNSTPGSGEQSALNSPSATERQTYLESQGVSQEPSRRGSTLGDIVSGDEADHEDAPRVRDFVRGGNNAESSKASPERKKRQKKHRKRHQKKKAKQEAVEDIDDQEVTVLDTAPVASPEAKEVGFADEVQVAENPAGGLTPSKSTLNMRSFPRPAMPKMFSQNVFVTPAPVPAPAPRPAGPSRSLSSGAHLRRTSSLPDRLNKQISQTPSRSGQQQTLVVRTDPLPPFHHRARQAIRKIKSEGEGDSDDEGEEHKPEMSRTAAVVLLLITTGLVAACAEFMVDAIPEMIASSPSVSQAFIGLIILPIVGNAAEHATAVTVAAKNKMDLAIGVAVGSSIQIALFVTPIVVLLGWILDTNMSLYFNIFETISLFVTAFVVNFLVLDGRSNYLEGSLLCAAYVIIALGAFFYPDPRNQSSFGSVGNGGG